SLSSIWFLSDKPLAFEGALVVRFGNSASVSVEATLVWVVLVLVYAFHAARLPVWKLMRPRGFLMSLLLAVALMIFYIALALEHPTLTAPQFHSIASAPGALPWILLIVGPGALAGWQLLIIHGVTAREMRHETDARYVGYGTALVQGIVALSALLIAASVFPNAEAWSKQYPAAPSALDFPRLAVAYIDGFAHYAAALRLDPSLARHLAATVIAGLTLAVLEAAVRTLKHLLGELAPPPTASTRVREGRLWIVVLAGGTLALYDGRGLGGIAAWPLLALVSLWLAAAGFAMIALALRAQARPALLVGTLGAAVAGIAAWTSVAQLWMWWSVNAWTAFIAGLLVLLLAAAILREVARALMRRPAVALDT
ncbi:MAG TPA: carbon starvation CstA family protein, partial [Candidatus Elarobacter sp.]